LHCITYLVVVVFGTMAQTSLRLCHFKSDQDEIWHDCSLSNCASINGIRLPTSGDEPSRLDIRGVTLRSFTTMH